MALADLLKQMAHTSASGGGNYITKHGKYRLVLKSMEIDSKFGGDTFVAELYIEKAEKIGSDEPHAAGTTISFVQQFKDDKVRRQMAMANTKAFILALTNEEDFAETDEAAATEFIKNLEMACGKDNPLRGAAVDCETYSKLTKDKSKTLILPKWIAIGDQNADTMGARRKALAGVEAAK